ncbi:MAG: sulfur carrier protein ThiS [Muribaculaceae bacterium]
MNIIINKKEHSFAEGITLKQALEQVPNIPNSGIALALNNEVVAKDQWDSTVLHDGDQITIIKAFYGG